MIIDLNNWRRRKELEPLSDERVLEMREYNKALRATAKEEIDDSQSYYRASALIEDQRDLGRMLPEWSEGNPIDNALLAVMELDLDEFGF